jgi:hypothetical protein
MKSPSGWFFIGLAILWPVLRLRAQEPPPPTDAFHMVAEAGLPNDWTHRHVVFSAAASESKLQPIAEREPRYWLQLLRHRGSQDAFSADGENAIKIATAQLERLKQLEQWQRERDPDFFKDESLEFETWRKRWPSRRREPLKHDWSQTFQTGGVTYAFTSPTYPAKFSLSSANPTPNCAADYVAFTLPTGSSVFPGSFNIIAFNNLYVTTAGGASFCLGTAPQAIFEYNASTAGGPLNGSPALSLDGTLIAFIENGAVPNGGAVFHVLKWHSGDTQKVDTSFPNAFNSAILANCATNGAVAPCEYNVQYTPAASAKTAALSSPFVDYTNDTAYVSDDGGNVYAIAPVFTATSANPPKVQTGWPVNVGSSVVLTPPVYDSISRNVFVASTAGTEFFIKTATSTTGSCLSGSAPCVGSSTFAFTGTGSIQEAPVVDSSTGRVFVFGTQTGGTSGSYMVQTDTALTAGSVQAAQIGAGTLSAIHPGTPDNKYFTNVGTGKFYACGQTLLGEGVLYAFGFGATGVLNTTPVTGSPFGLGQAIVTLSPCSDGLTEIFNQSGNKDWLFLAVANRCVNTVFGNNGCIISLDITNAFPSAVAHQIALPGSTGATGIIIDNVSDASLTMTTTDIYYIVQSGMSCLDYLGSSHTGTCAASATQSGLQ